MTETDLRDHPRYRWKAFETNGYALYTECASCGEQRHCKGTSRDRMLCLDCFAAREAEKRKPKEKQKLPKLNSRRGGKPGPRSGYTYRMRRPRSEMIAAVHRLRAEGLAVPTIADRTGLSDKTVRNYLSEGPERPQSAPLDPSQNGHFAHEKKRQGARSPQASGDVKSRG